MTNRSTAVMSGKEALIAEVLCNEGITLEIISFEIKSPVLEIFQLRTKITYRLCNLSVNI